MNKTSHNLSGRKLKVSYIAQINENACGAAVLEMIYKHYGIKDVSQEDILKRYQELEPHGSGNIRITTDSLVLDARKRGFRSFWGRVDYSNVENSMNLLKTFIEDLHLPIIVCQKFTEDQPLIGHFRIVLGINKNVVYLHDPHREKGGPYRKWKTQQFMEFWQPTGNNVTGGIFIIISK
ncbi:MAG: papain-like cysteine protease family protein [Candidatus Daviesbacteria bacterium]|nr:papain-like cysteine protease family protein [Candidatus Daviesbacteria bacterium]